MKIIYIVIIALLVLFYIMYKPTLSFYLLAAAVLFPILMAVPTYIAKRKLRFGIKITSVGGNSLNFEISVHNPTIIPLFNAEVFFCVRSAFSGVLIKDKAVVTAFPNSVQKLKAEIEIPRCIWVRAALEKVCVSDPLHLFRFKVKSLERRVFSQRAVYPKLEKLEELNISSEFIPKIQTAEKNGNAADNLTACQEPFELLDLHEYREGDRLNRINWKISAKYGQPMVREYGGLSETSEKKSRLALCVEIYPKKTGDFSEEADRILRSFVSVMYFLVQNHIVFSAAVNGFEKAVEINSIRDMWETLQIILTNIESSSLKALPCGLSQVVYFANKLEPERLDLITAENPDAEIIFAGNTDGETTAKKIKKVSLEKGSIYDILKRREK